MVRSSGRWTAETERMGDPSDQDEGLGGCDMTEHVRIRAAFFAHPQTEHLESIVRGGAYSLLQLAAIVAQVHQRSTTGDIGGWAPHILEEIVEWPGETGTMIQVLTETGWVIVGPDGRPRLRGLGALAFGDDHD